jgi:hypothetical protein
LTPFFFASFSAAAAAACSPTASLDDAFYSTLFASIADCRNSEKAGGRRRRGILLHLFIRVLFLSFAIWPALKV